MRARLRGPANAGKVNSLTRQEESYNDERGEAPARAAYRKAWTAWHAAHKEMPKLHFPQKERAFPV